jgi:hypothetical protein
MCLFHTFIFQTNPLYQPILQQVKTIVLFCILSLVTTTIFAQKNNIKGLVLDSTGKKPLSYAIIALIKKSDSTLLLSTRSLLSGQFAIDKVKPGNYSVLITYPQMADFLLDIAVQDTSQLDLGKIVMNSRFQVLQEVIVRSAKAIRMHGDTLKYRADSFAVSAGANVEELLRRLPGIEVNFDGSIRAQGKNVKRVLVDGDEFFNDDPTLATRYLKAIAVEEIQVYDQKSEKAKLTGIDDGEENKTINIKLKENYKRGLFGKLLTGGNADGSYNHEAMLNIFRNREKASAFITHSNTNGLGLSYNDRSKYLSDESEFVQDESGNLIGNMHLDGNYGVSGLPNITTSGLQYINKWKDNKHQLSLNHRYNQLGSSGWSSYNSLQILPDGSERKTGSYNTNTHHEQINKGSGSYSFQIDSFSNIRAYTYIETERSLGKSSSSQESKDGNDNFLSKSLQNRFNEGNSEKMHAALFWKRSFRKIGRLVSANLISTYDQYRNSQLSETDNQYFNNSLPPTLDSLNQLQKNNQNTRVLAGNINYSEPISKSILLNIEYGWRSTNSERNRDAMGRGSSGKYDSRIDSLSNDYLVSVHSHNPGISLQYRESKLTMNAVMKVNLLNLRQEDRLTANTSSSRNFTNLFPSFLTRYSLSRMRNLSFNYNGRASTPSIDQLQPLKDNSNPFYVRNGNPNLRPSFNHNFNLSFNKLNLKGNSFNVSMNWYQIRNAITSQQSIDQFNKTTQQFVNRDLPGNFSIWINQTINIKNLGAKNASGYISFSMGYGNSGSLYILNNNDITSRQNRWSFSPMFSYNITGKLNWQYQPSFTYSTSRSALTKTQNFNHQHTSSLKIFLPWKLELQTDVVMYFQPANRDFGNSRNVIKWNASLNKKFFKHQQGEMALSVFDILNQNTGYSRSISGLGFSESAENFIPRYGILSFIWNLSKNF